MAAVDELCAEIKTHFADPRLKTHVFNFDRRALEDALLKLAVGEVRPAYAQEGESSWLSVESLLWLMLNHPTGKASPFGRRVADLTRRALEELGRPDP
jgi:hypothetical protein